MDVPGLIEGANLLSRPAEEFENDAAVESIWAEKAFEYAQVHFNILSSVEPMYLKLTDIDDELYIEFRKEFPAMKVEIINENEIKSHMGKQKWRKFISKFDGRINDASFGTLLRINSNGEYTDENTMLSPRIQFLVVEVARNREGNNDIIRKKYRPAINCNGFNEY